MKETGSNSAVSGSDSDRCSSGTEDKAQADSGVSCVGDGEALGEYSLDLNPQEYLKQAKSWVINGANLVGGCCGIFPEHIREMQELNSLADFKVDEATV